MPGHRHAEAMTSIPTLKISALGGDEKVGHQVSVEWLSTPDYDDGKEKRTQVLRIEIMKWKGRELFSDMDGETLANGLQRVENKRLADTPHIDEAAILILRGLMRLVHRRLH